jgi:hypothetical protein
MYVGVLADRSRGCSDVSSQQREAGWRSGIWPSPALDYISTQPPSVPNCQKQSLAALQVESSAYDGPRLPRRTKKSVYSQYIYIPFPLSVAVDRRVCNNNNNTYQHIVLHRVYIRNTYIFHSLCLWLWTGACVIIIIIHISI